jgi:hypothetical protein
MMMVQFDSRGLFVRKARFDRRMMHVWQCELPRGFVVLSL